MHLCTSTLHDSGVVCGLGRFWVGRHRQAWRQAGGYGVGNDVEGGAVLYAVRATALARGWNHTINSTRLSTRPRVSMVRVSFFTF